MSLLSFFSSLIASSIIFVACYIFTNIFGHELTLPLYFIPLILSNLLVINIQKKLYKQSHQSRKRKSIAIEGPRQEGSIKWFNSKKQYGFIKTNDDNDIFVHRRFINGDPRKRVRENMKVEFSICQTDKGLQAEDVNIIE
jgi:cold shock CspA family protein